MDRTVAIKVTSDGKAFVVDQAANAEAAAKFGRQIEEAGKQADAAAAKVGRAGKAAKESGDDFKRAGDGAGGAAPRVKQLGDTAQRTAQQMRQVAPQITDIVTQLAAGQNPMQIFIQQGGQLKDVFGGVGPAVRAVGGYVMGMINPVTIAAGVVGGLAIAFTLGNEESAKFTRQLLLSGNAAGATVSDYQQMASSLAAVAGTKGAALQALGEMAQAGRVSADQLQRFTGIAQELDRLVGKPVSDTAKEFAALGEAPVAASLKLTQTYNYLTAAVYQQIKALDDQGRHTEAAKLAQEAFAQGFEERIPKMQVSLGLLSRAWLEVKDAITKTGDSLLNLGRAATLQEQVANLERELAAAQGKDKNRPSRLPWEPSEAELQRQLDLKREELRVERQRAAIAADRLTTTQARARFEKMTEDSLTKQELLERAIAKATADGAASGAKQAEIDKVIAAARKKYADTEAVSAHRKAVEAQIAEIERGYRLEKLVIADGLDAIDSLRKQDLISHYAVVQRKLELHLQDVAADEAAVKKKLALAKTTKDSAKEVIQLQGQLNELEQRRQNLKNQAARDGDEILVGTQLAWLKATNDATKGIEDQTVALEQQNRVFGLGKAALLDLTLAQLEKSKADLEATDRVVPGYIEALNRQIDAVKRLRDANASNESLEAGKKSQEKELQELRRAQDKALDDWIKWVDKVDGTFHDGFVAALDKNKGSWDSYTSSLATTFKSTVADEIYKMFVKPIWVNIVGSITGMNGTLSGVGGRGLLGAASDASSLTSMGSKIWSGFESGFSSFTAPGGAYYNFASSGVGQSLGLSNSAAIVGNNPSAYAPAGTQLSGGGGLGSLGYGAGAAATIAVIAYAAAEAWKSTRGERRGGGRFDYYPVSGSSYTSGPDGERAAGSDDFVKGLLNTTAAALNESFKALGKDLTVAALTGAYETSAAGRGGVFSGGRLSSGAAFGEDGSGSNYDWSSPLNSKYEMWNAVAAKYAMVGDIDMNGDPAKLATDLQQTFIAAIQASVGLIPKIVAETFQMQSSGGSGFTLGGSGYEGGAESGELTTDLTATRWLRVYDEEMKQRVRDLGLLPKRIADLILDVDPEALSAEAAAEIAGKIGALVANVNGFRAIVEALPVAQLRGATFDIAAGLVEAAGGLDAFAASVSGYVENFYSADEKRAQAILNINKTLGGVGLSLDGIDMGAASARAQFREMVEAIDLTTEAGQAQYAVLMSVAGSVAGVTQALDATMQSGHAAAAVLAKRADIEAAIMEQLGDSSARVALERQRELDGLDESLRPLQQRLYALQDEATAAAAATKAMQDMKSALQSAVDTARADLQKVYDAQRQQLQDRIAAEDDARQALQQVYDAEASQLQARIDDIAAARQQLIASYRAEEAALRDRISAIESAQQALRSAYDAQVQQLQQQQTAIDAARQAVRTAYEQEAAAYEAQAAQLQQRVEAVTAARQQLVASYQAEEAAIRERVSAIQSAEQALRSAFTTQVQVLQQQQGAIDAARQAVRTAYEQQAAELQQRQSQIDAARAQLAQAQQAELGAQTQSIAKLRQFTEELKRFRDALVLGELSSLSPEEKLRQAQAQYASGLAAARAGDESAQDQFTATAQALLEAARAYYGSTTSYANIFSSTLADVDALGAGRSDAQRQLELLQQQLDALGDVGSHTLTVAEATAQLEALLAQGEPAAQLAALRAQAAQYVSLDNHVATVAQAIDKLNALTAQGDPQAQLEALKSQVAQFITLDEHVLTVPAAIADLQALLAQGDPQAQLEALKSQVSQLVDVNDSVMSVQQAIDALAALTLEGDPAQQLATLKAQLATDLEALRAQAAQYVTLDDHVVTVAEAIDALNALTAAGDPAAQLEALRAQVAQFISLNEHVQTVPEAIANLQALLAQGDPQAQLEALESQVSQLVELNQTEISVHDAITQLTALTAAADPQAQLEALNAQVQGLLDVNGAVLTVDQAIADLQAAIEDGATARSQLAHLEQTAGTLLRVEDTLLSIDDAIAGYLNAVSAQSAFQVRGTQVLAQQYVSQAGPYDPTRAWANQMAALDGAGGATAEQMDALYVKYLGRHAELNSGAALAGAIDSGTTTLAQVEQQLANSIEAQARQLGIQREWLKLVNETLGTGFTEEQQARLFVDGSHAKGLSFVPFDGYVAETHEGEAIATRATNLDINSIDWRSVGQDMRSLREFGRGTEASETLVAEIRRLQEICGRQAQQIDRLNQHAAANVAVSSDGLQQVVRHLETANEWASRQTRRLRQLAPLEGTRG